MLISLISFACLVLMWIISKDKKRCRASLFSRNHKPAQMSWEDYERYIEYEAPCYRHVIFMHKHDFYRFEDYNKLITNQYYYFYF